MKKLAVLALLAGITLIGCNKQIVDLNYQFNRAIIYLPNGEIIEGCVESWMDYDGEQLQVTIDGVVYLVSSYNCILISDGEVEQE